MTDTCSSLIEPIMAAHRKVIEAQRGSLKYAIECGKHLNSAKETVTAETPGGWLKWLKNNWPNLPERTARLYMRLAEHEDQLDQAAITEAMIGGALSIRRAAALISDEAKDDEDNGDETAETEDEGDTNDNAGTSPTSSSSSSGQSSPDLAEMLQNSAPDEVFEVLKDTWDQDQLNALADLIDTYLNPKAQAA